MNATPLGQLSAELRNRIWECVLIQDEPITARFRDKDRKANSKPFIGFLLTCKQAQSEGTGMFYSLNIFRFEYEYQNHKPSPDRFTNVFGKHKHLVKHIMVTPEVIDSRFVTQGELLYEDLIYLEKSRGQLESLQFELEFVWKTRMHEGCGCSKTGEVKDFEGNDKLVIDIFNIDVSRAKIARKAPERLKRILNVRPKLNMLVTLERLGFEWPDERTNRDCTLRCCTDLTRAFPWA